MKQQTAKEIDEEAADWAAKVDRGLSAGEQSDLDHWLDQDDRRIGAYGRMRAIALQTERVAALGPVHSPAEFAFAEPRGVSRRRVLAGGAIAASLIGAGAIGWHQMNRGRYKTRKGEARQLALDDGSVVTLNTETALAVKLGANRRDVEMTRGEALFDVERDPSRPFVVIASDTRVRVLGTSFIVRALPGRPVEVLVRKGLVEVSRNDVVVQPRKLTAYMRAISPIAVEGAPIDIAVADVPKAALDRVLAWRDGHVDFEGETLEQAVTEFARYSDMRITVDPVLAGEQIAGVYQANNPVGFAHAVAGSLRAHVRVVEGEIKIEKFSS
ncbi:FecR family protein [Sphingobium ummariense]